MLRRPKCTLSLTVLEQVMGPAKSGKRVALYQRGRITILFAIIRDHGDITNAKTTNSNTPTKRTNMTTLVTRPSRVYTEMIATPTRGRHLELRVTSGATPTASIVTALLATNTVPPRLISETVTTVRRLPGLATMGVVMNV